jgi:DNA-binding NtrC family response regulator
MMPATVEEGATRPLAILIVDDEPAIREVFTRFLGRRGHDVVACGSAEEALQIASTRTTSFDVIVTDLILPDMTGLDLARALIESGSSAQVILLTGEPNRETADVARQLRVHRYLAKPIRAGALIDVVEEAGRVAHGGS